MTRRRLRQYLHRLGEKAGVSDVHPHRFRHTFAIKHLRDGGDVFMLKELLGLSDLETTGHYGASLRSIRRTVIVKPDR